MKPWQSHPTSILIVVLGLLVGSSVNAQERVIAKNLAFNSIEPCVVLDTSKTAEGPLAAGEVRKLSLAGEVDLTLQGGTALSGCGIPAVPEAKAVVLNVVVKQPLANGELKLWATDRPEPEVAAVSFSVKSPWQNVAFDTVVALGQKGAGEELNIEASDAVDVVATAVGYYTEMAVPPELIAAGTKVAAAVDSVRDTMANLTLTGATGLELTHASGMVCSKAGGLMLQEDGDTYGSMRLSIVNRFQKAGALFEQLSTSQAKGVADFIFKPNYDSSLTRNFRLENRAANDFVQAPEFQIGIADNPTLVVADNKSSFRKGSVGIGTTSPSAKLDVRGGSTSPGIYGESTATNGDGVYGVSSNGTSAYGLRGYSSQGYGIYASGGAVGGYFVGPKTYVSGNLGVGTSGPAYKLDVTGTANLNKGVASGQALMVNGAEALWYNGTYFSWGYGASKNYFADPVGIGTTNTSSSHLYVQTTLDTAITGITTSSSGNGLTGAANTGTAAYGVYGGSSTGYAGYFNGNVRVNGTLSKTAGSFQIDHPLDPANKYLYHSFVESPDMMNIYNGIVVLGAKGEAAVKLPDWFGALNRDYRYQLTAIGQPGPDLYIAEEFANGQFTIAGGEPGMKVSWQVTGIRQDAYANAHRIPVEQDKPKAEQGSYLHPELFGQPPEKSVEWATKPELMRALQQPSTQQ